MITYEKLDPARLSMIHLKWIESSRNNRHPGRAILVEAEGYPQDIDARLKLGQDADGHTIWGKVQRFRGLDKNVVRRYNHPRYSGAALRQLRAIKGVGRPWVTLLHTTPSAGQSSGPSGNPSDPLNLKAT